MEKSKAKQTKHRSTGTETLKLQIDQKRIPLTPQMQNNSREAPRDYRETNSHTTTR